MKNMRAIKEIEVANSKAQKNEALKKPKSHNNKLHAVSLDNNPFKIELSFLRSLILSI